MTRIQARFRRIVARYGDDVGGEPAMVAPLSPLRARSYVPDAAVDAAARPMWIAYAGWDHPASEGSTVGWGARSLTVKRTIDVRLAGRTVARLLVLFSA